MTTAAKTVLAVQKRLWCQVFSARVKDAGPLGPGYEDGGPAYLRRLEDGHYEVHSGRGISLRVLTQEQAAACLETRRGPDGKPKAVPQDVADLVLEIMRISRVVLAL